MLIGHCGFRKHLTNIRIRDEAQEAKNLNFDMLTTKINKNDEGEENSFNENLHFLLLGFFKIIGKFGTHPQVYIRIAISLFSVLMIDAINIF